MITNDFLKNMEFYFPKRKDNKEEIKYYRYVFVEGKGYVLVEVKRPKSSK